MDIIGRRLDIMLASNQSRDRATGRNGIAEQASAASRSANEVS